MAKNEIASVLAFEKKLSLSDGQMFSTTWDKKYDIAEKLILREKSIRGTISNRLKNDKQKDPLKMKKEIEAANLQRVDACYLPMGHDTLKLEFTLKVLSGIENPSACNSVVYLTKYKENITKYIETTGFKELSKRYAANLANARYLWRNRLGAEEIEVQVTANGEKTWSFNAFDFSLQDFDSADTQPDLLELAEMIADALMGTKPYLILKVTTYAHIGAGQEVYPSEEWIPIEGKVKGDRSKVLYQVDGGAAMHSQKLGNAIRTIDTWYPEYTEPEASVGPIPVETYGAVTNIGKAFRTSANKADFYTLFDDFVYDGDLNEAEKDYVAAVLIRGGVFGKSGKEG